MKNKTLKYQITVVYLLSTLLTFAQPGSDDTNGDLEGTDTPAAPIDGYIWILAAIGLVYVFLRLRSIALQGNLENE